MPKRPCIDCGRLCEGTRCPACASAAHRARDQRRGNRHARGYGNDHDERRAALLAKLVPGTPCPRCGEPMWPHQRLQAGHPIGSGLRVDRTSKADHLSHGWCNEGARD